MKFAISKSGYDVKTTTDPNNLIVSSDYPSLKYYASGQIEFTINAGGAGFYEHTETLAHNLGYIPFFFGLGRIDSFTAGLYKMLPIGNQSTENMEIYADATNLYFYAGWGFTGAGNVTYTFQYKLFKNRLGL